MIRKGPIVFLFLFLSNLCFSQPNPCWDHIAYWNLDSHSDVLNFWNIINDCFEEGSPKGLMITGGQIHHLDPLFHEDLALVHNGSLLVIQNTSLTSLHGLEYLVEVADELWITGNTLLTNCEIEAFCAAFANSSADITISGNGAGCQFEDVAEFCNGPIPPKVVINHFDPSKQTATIHSVLTAPGTSILTVATDGTESLLLEHDEGFWRLRNDQEGSDISGSISTIESQGEFFTYYKSPIIYDRSNALNYLDFYAEDDLNNPAISISLTFIPVPALLLHGIWSDEVTWASVEGSLIDEGWLPNWISSPSYSTGESWSEQSEFVENEISSLLNSMHSQGCFVNQTSIVSHSMGGLVARQFMMGNIEGSAKVNRLISINTPHSGSQLSNLTKTLKIDGALQN